MDPVVISTQKTQGKSRKIATTKGTFMSNKNKSSPLDNTNIILPLEISLTLPTLDYSIVKDMKKTCENISIYELTKLTGQRNIPLHSLGQTSINSVSSSNKGPRKSSNTLKSMLKVPCMEEENLL